jgi:hypothetical protein
MTCRGLSVECHPEAVMAHTQMHGDHRETAGPVTGLDEPEAMLALLRQAKPQSDAEALTLLRRNFPYSALSDRVAAVSRWRMS